MDQCRTRNRTAVDDQRGGGHTIPPRWSSAIAVGGPVKGIPTAILPRWAESALSLDVVGTGVGLVSPSWLEKVCVMCEVSARETGGLWLV